MIRSLILIEVRELPTPLREIAETIEKKHRLQVVAELDGKGTRVAYQLEVSVLDAGWWHFQRLRARA